MNDGLGIEVRYGADVSDQLEPSGTQANDSFSRRVFLGMGVVLAGAVSIGDFLATVDPASAAPLWGYPFTAYASQSRGLEYNGSTLTHEGVDYTPGEGTPIHAVADGTVTVSGVSGSNGAYGQSIWVDHGGGWTSRYAHMIDGSRRVGVGATVARGTRLGDVGNTGRSFGAHLHLEIRMDGNVRDPNILLQDAPLAGSAPAPQPQQRFGRSEHLMYIRRESTGEIAIFGGDFRQSSGGQSGRHVFANQSEYTSWRRVVTTYNSEVRRVGLPSENLVPEPPANPADVLGINEGDWGVVCGVYGV